MCTTLTPERLACAPIADLCAELDALLVEVDISDPRFFGSLVNRRGSGPVLALPPARLDRERDTVARMLLGRWAGVPLAPLPASVELAELDG